MAAIIDINSDKSCILYFCKMKAFRELFGKNDILKKYLTAEKCKDCPIKGEIPDEHGDLIDRNELQDVLQIVLSLVISNKLTDNEIALVQSTISAISDAVNELEVIVPSTDSK